MYYKSNPSVGVISVSALLECALGALWSLTEDPMNARRFAQFGGVELSKDFLLAPALPTLFYSQQLILGALWSVCHDEVRATTRDSERGWSMRLQI